MRKFLIIPVLFIYLSLGAVAQSTQNSIEVSVNRSLNFFTPDQQSHTGNVKLNGNIWGGEFAYKFNMANNHADYIRIFHMSSIDVVASYRNFNNITIDNDPATAGRLGSTYFVIGKLNINLLTLGSAKIIFAPGFGLAYATQTYFTNKNPLTGSHINFASQAGIKVLTPLSEKLSLEGGIDILHYSNGGYSIPNNGINSLNVSFGIIRKIGQATPVKEADPKPITGSSVEVGADIGRRGVFQRNDGLFKSGFFAAYGYRLGAVLGIKAQFDAVYYYTVFDANNLVATNQYFGNSNDRWRTGVSLGADIWLGKLAVTANYGYYLHFNSNYPTKFYWMPGFKYFLTPGLGLQVKTYIHKNSADFTGAGLIFNLGDHQLKKIFAGK